MISWVELEPTAHEFTQLVDLIVAEVHASRQLEEIIFNSRSPKREHYTYLHRPLELRNATTARFTNICLISPDVIRLRDFYRDVLQTEVDGDETYAVITTQGGGLTIFSQAGMEGMAPGSTVGAAPGGMVLEFVVPDVDAEYARLLEMGVPIVKVPTTQPWGSRSVWFRDPDGNIVNFAAKVF